MAWLLGLVLATATWAIEVQGHRGARALRPENTLPAFEYALGVGVDTLELDMQVTKDGVIVISHDPFVNPEHCSGPNGAAVPEGLAIHSLTIDEVKKYDCGSKKNPKFPKQTPVPHTPMPRLTEVFEFVKSSKTPNAKKVQFNIETKIYPAHLDLSPEPAAFAKLVLEDVKNAGVMDRVTVESFDNRTLRELKRLAPKLRRVLLTSDNHIDYVAAAKADSVYAISPDHEWITAEDVKALHAAGFKVIPWTVNDPAQWRRMLDFGVDGIITDDPAALMEYLKTNTKN